MTRTELLSIASDFAHLKSQETAIESLRLATDGAFSDTDLADALASAVRYAHLRVLTGHELFAVPAVPQRMLLDPYIPRARQGGIYGGPGVGKSQLQRIIGGGIASGSEAVFGRFPVTEQAVVMTATAEEDEQEVRRGLSITAAASGYDLEAVLDNYRIIPLRGTEFTLQSAADRQWLEDQVAEIRPALLDLDSMASLSGRDIKDDQAVLPLLRWGARIATEYDVTVTWTAHDRKENPNALRKSNDLDDLFGSRQVSAQLDFAYRLIRKGEDRVLRCSKARGFMEPEDMSLEVVQKPDEMFGMRCVTGMSRMSRESEVVDAVREHLTASPGDSMSRTRDTVARMVKRRPVDVGDVVKDLLAEGFINNEGNANRFKLEWAGENMSGMSQPVPDTPTGQHVRMSHPPLGGETRDMGHVPEFTCTESDCENEVGGPHVRCGECLQQRRLAS